MYGSRTLGVNCRVAFSHSVSSFNLVSLDGMKRCNIPPLIILGCVWICACVASKANWRVFVCVCVFVGVQYEKATKYCGAVS